MQELREETQGRDIAWKIGQLPEAMVDRSMMRLVMINLLANAVKFTSKRERAEIEVGASSNEADGIVVFVRDNGVGFDMEYAASSLVCSNGCIQRKTTKAPALDWPMSNGSFTVTKAGLGPRVRSIEAPHSISLFRKQRRRQPMPRFKRMLLVEDDARDVELTLEALDESQPGQRGGCRTRWERGS